MFYGGLSDETLITAVKISRFTPGFLEINLLQHRLITWNTRWKMRIKKINITTSVKLTISK